MELAGDPHESVREAVAENLGCPPEVLDKFSRSRVYAIRLAVAKNPSTPATTLRRLARDRGPTVRQAILAREDLDEKTRLIAMGFEAVDALSSLG